MDPRSLVQAASRFSRCGILSALCFAWTPLAHAAASANVAATLEVDASEAPRGIERAHLVLPVKPGALTLLYPEWLPGEHAPDGPIGSLSGLKFLANGRALQWRRDSQNMYAFHLKVPAGVRSLDVMLEVLSVRDATNQNADRTSTEALAIILWNQVLVYPAGSHSDDLQYTAKLKLPSGWSFASALPKAAGLGDTTEFRTVSLTTLIDSPVLAGSHLRTIELGGTPSAFLHLAADSDAALNAPQATQAHMRQLIREANALFGATHYREYHFLWTLSDRIAYEGIEHHESSDNRTAERTLIDDDLRGTTSVTTLLPHEYVHSWNGKYRRPIGLATGNYDTPMRGDLLWVYEGLTEYLGLVLSARSGLATLEDARIGWADIAALMDSHRGREWRPLEDTAVAAQLGYYQPTDWRAWIRGTDFYRESALLWLEADVLIRTKTGGAKSLDDFCRLFYGAPSSPPKVIPYDFEAIVAALNSVLPYDWRQFWTERLERIKAGAPLEGLAASGWRLSFATELSSVQKGEGALFKWTDLRFSLGFIVLDDGAVTSYLIPGSPADQAGMAPGSRLVAVNGRKYSKEVLQDAINAGGPEPRTISLLVEKDEMFRSLELHYAGKARYPRLERVAEVPDLLTAIETAQSP
ncbi:MAG: PDZ domain-containing protein [Steroidobacteraceae bacterium]|jgi:predicted metalloprotease with PDZ domain